MNRELLRDCGHALYGHSWAHPLGEALGINPRTIQRWASGALEIPLGIVPGLASLVEQRISELQTLRHAIKP